MSEEHYIILEYNEKEQGWHYNYNDVQEDSNGYRTVCKSISLTQATEFTEEVEDAYLKKDIRVSFKEVKELFKTFLLSDVNK